MFGKHLCLTADSDKNCFGGLSARLWKAMKHLKSFFGYLFAVLLNLFFHLHWSIPAWLLLILHFWQGWHIRWFWLALSIWALYVIGRTVVFSLLHRGGQGPDPKTHNRNPYSRKNKDVFPPAGNHNP